jgi:hypothetical protein
MRISSGMAEIGFNNISAEKIYVWPQYNEGRVQNIRNIDRRTDPSAVYYKPSPRERERMLALYRETSYTEYSPAGRITRPAAGIRPGTLFDAIA